MDEAGEGRGWRVSVRSEEPGWLEVPALEGERARAWVAAAAGELREDWGARWRPEHGVLVPAALEHALASRTPDDALCFQLWPERELRTAILHVQLGAAAGAPEAHGGAASPVEHPLLGPGLRIVRRTSIEAPEAGGPVPLVGVDLVWSDGEALVRASLEPTLPPIAAEVLPLVHALVASLEVEGPDGPFRASPPQGSFEAWGAAPLGA